MRLQARVIGIDAIAPCARWRGAAMQQVGLHSVQKAVVQAALCARRAGRGFRIGVRGDLARRMHHFIAAEQGHEVLAGRAPVAQQRVLACFVAEGIGARAQARAQRLQVAPVFPGGRGQVEMQGAHARLRGHHPQYVRRHVERAEREQPRGQATRQRPPIAEAGQVLLDAPHPMVAACGHCAPQDGLRIVGAGAGFPAQQPVAAPGLVLLEHPGQFPGQRPRLQRIVAGHVGGQLRHRRLRNHGRVGQRGIQAPVQAPGIKVAVGLAQVRIQRARHELAGGQEFEVGGNAVAPRQRCLQPTPHRGLRDQDDVRRKQRLARRGRTQRIRQQFSQHVQRIAVVEAEIGRAGIRHRPGHCAGAGSHGQRPQTRRPPGGGLRGTLWNVIERWTQRPSRSASPGIARSM